MHHGLIHDVKLLKIQDHTAAGTSTITSDAVDTQGFGGVLFITSVGTAASNNIFKIQQSSDNAGSDDYTDLEGTAVASGTSDEDVWIDVLRPAKRYLKLIGTRGTSSTLETMWAILYNPASMPVDNTTTGTIVGEAFNTPSEGTA